MKIKTRDFLIELFVSVVGNCFLIALYVIPGWFFIIKPILEALKK